MWNKKRVAEVMYNKTGLVIKKDLVTKVKDDGCPGHMGSGHWDVYVARAGEFTIVMYAYDNGDYSVTLM